MLEIYEEKYLSVKNHINFISDKSDLKVISNADLEFIIYVNRFKVIE